MQKHNEAFTRLIHSSPSKPAAGGWDQVMTITCLCTSPALQQLTWVGTWAQVREEVVDIPKGLKVTGKSTTWRKQNCSVAALERWPGPVPALLVTCTWSGQSHLRSRVKSSARVLQCDLFRSPGFQFYMQTLHSILNFIVEIFRISKSSYN